MEKIETNHAPKAIGPYSQGIKASNFVFVSGQLPVDPATGKLVEGDIAVLTHRVLKNIEAILKESGASFENVVRMDVFLKDLKGDFAKMNEEYGKFLQGPIYPARQTVQVSELPLGSPIEISCIAQL